MRLLLLLPVLAACDTGHLGNPLTLPARAIGAAASNAVYDARRDRVAAYLSTHRNTLTEPAIQAGLWQIAPVPPGARAKVLGEIAALPDGPEWSEHATVIVMVHH